MIARTRGSAALFISACGTLWQREIVRFLRQRGRIAGALGTPVVFWFMAGAGLSQSFKMPGASQPVSYLHYSFPGALASIVMFTSIFSTISIIDDRKEGFMQSVLVAPCPRAAIVLGKVLGATTLGIGQALVFMLLGPLAGMHWSWSAWPQTLGAMTLVALGMTNVGFWLAWRCESTQGFHAIMNLFLVPMLVLSGAFFPLAGASAWLGWIMRINPMTYGVGLIRDSLGSPGAAGDDAGFAINLAVSIAFAVVTFLAVLSVVARDPRQAVA